MTTTAFPSQTDDHRLDTGAVRARLHDAGSCQSCGRPMRGADTAVTVDAGPDRTGMARLHHAACQGPEWILPDSKRPAVRVATTYHATAVLVGGDIAVVLLNPHLEAVWVVQDLDGTWVPGQVPVRRQGDRPRAWATPVDGRTRLRLTLEIAAPGRDDAPFKARHLVPLPARLQALLPAKDSIAVLATGLLGPDTSGSDLDRMLPRLRQAPDTWAESVPLSI